jgi:hypothetical protein
MICKSPGNYGVCSVSWTQVWYFERNFEDEVYPFYLIEMYTIIDFERVSLGVILTVIIIVMHIM